VLLALLLVLAYRLATRPRKEVTSYEVTILDVGITTLDEGVGNADWSPDGRWMAYTRYDPDDGYADIYVMKPDGSEKTCVSCTDEFPRKHKGAVAFHPSGNYLVYTAQNEDAVGAIWDRVATPGIGFGNSLWAMTADGKRTWTLRKVPTSETQPRAVIDPKFNRDGSRLYWSENTGKMQFGPAKEWGEWAIYSARFRESARSPSLSDTRRLQPGKNRSFYIVTDAAGPDDDILFSGNLAVGQSVHGMDIYSWRPGEGLPRVLAPTLTEWDEHARYSPDGRFIAFMSTRGIGVAFKSVYDFQWLEDLQSELWLATAVGSNARRLTFFNVPHHPDALWLSTVAPNYTRAFVSYMDWSPDGRHILLTLTCAEGPRGLRSRLALLDLSRRNPESPYPSVTSNPHSAKG
jgi:Tol biopolymer transport system component